MPVIGDCLGDDDPTAIGAEDLLLSWGAARIDHPGGTLFDHLLRVRDLLARWRADSVLQVAGLCHAVYGTDGFAPHLVDLSRRCEVATMVGADVETLVYRYASCDRAWVYPRLSAASQVEFRDRFTGRVQPVRGRELREFMELTAANELDLARHNPTFAAEVGPRLHALFARTRPLLSAVAWQDCAATLRP
ncbi:hypothetical protein FF36_00358 [Frankia torreyi]|uniref:DUF6817 domain-containing protein n=2 Tax=Frankia TaxID=1854 RepID=A0A0D8BMA9_9ACTN|nr:hypothetical protein FF36_00358 [Frankia torreyi]